MKVKLYHKFVEAARKNALNRKVSRKWLFRNNHEIELNDNSLIVSCGNSLRLVSRANFLSFVWNDLMWKEIWRKKYKRFSRKYWAAEAIMKRVIETGEEK